MSYLGDFAEDSTVYLMFDTTDKDGGSVNPSAYWGLRIYKNDSTTQKATANGITESHVFDGIPGVHHVTIDTSVDTGDADFWAVGNDYFVVLYQGTIDSETVSAAVGHFSIENRCASGKLDTTLSRLTATRAAYLDELGAANIPADVDTLVARLTADRAGYLDNLSAGAVAQASVCTEARLGELDAANIPADVDTLKARLTDVRAGYLDKLNITGNVASSGEVTVITNNTRVVATVPQVFERPDTDPIIYVIHLFAYDTEGKMEAPDSAPTVHVENQGGTSRDSNLISTTMTLLDTGHYACYYTIASGHALEQLLFTFTVIEGGETRVYGRQGLVVDTTAVDFTAADRAKVDEIKAKTDGLNFTGTDVKATLDGEKVTLANGAHGGYQTTLTLSSLVLSNSFDHAISVRCTAAGKNAVSLFSRLGAAIDVETQDGTANTIDLTAVGGVNVSAPQGISGPIDHLDVDVSSRAAAGSAMTLAEGAITRAACGANMIEGAYTLAQAIEALAAVCAGI
ncbi:MAG: hypothetical protein AMJ84_10165, partial [Acidithiobacillales bacterium SM23_46]